MVLEGVSVIMQVNEGADALVEDFIIPIPSLLSANSPGTVYVSFTRVNPTGRVESNRITTQRKALQESNRDDDKIEQIGSCE